MYSVYKLTSPDGLVYIGATMQDPQRRWQNGWGYQKNKRFFDDIMRIGWRNFTKEILYETDTMEDAYAKEIEMVAFYNSSEPEFGYNNNLGGFERTQRSIDASTKGWKENGGADKLRDGVKKHWKDPKKAEAHKKHLSEALHKPETQELLKQNMARRWEDPLYRERISKLLKERENPRSEESYKEAGRKLSKYRKEHPEKFNHSGKPRKPVVQSVIGTGEVVKIWECARDASRGINTGINGVSSACNMQVNLHGFHWDYMETVEIKDGFIVKRISVKGEE